METNSSTKVVEKASRYNVGDMETSLEHSVASITSSTSLEVVTSAKGNTRFNVKIRNSEDTVLNANDRFKCDIWGLCQLSDGMFVLVDHGNEKLKRLDNSYGFLDSIPIENPRNICEAGTGQVAVTTFWRLSGAVQLVSVGMSLTIGPKFVLNDIGRGIAYAQGKLFVCHSNYVGVYSIKGKPLLTIKHGQRNENIFLSPYDIVGSADGKEMFISDIELGIIRTDTQGRVLKIVDVANDECILTSPRGICMTSYGDLLICDRDSNSVIEYDPRFGTLKQVVKGIESLSKPKCVCTNWEKQVLVACLSSNYIHTHDLSHEFV